MEQRWIRKPLRAELSDPDAVLNRARELIRSNSFVDGIDLYDQLIEAFPQSATQLLAELYSFFSEADATRSRYELYQSRVFNFPISHGDSVLEIAIGASKFIRATESLILDSAQLALPITLPYKDKQFDFVYCSHVLSGVADPTTFCREIMRVGKRGYIETPTSAKDLFLNLASASHHRWAVEYTHETLIFTEYSPEARAGLKNSLVLDIHCAPQTDRERAFSALLNLKADRLNTMVLWDDTFNFEVRPLKVSLPQAKTTTTTTEGASLQRMLNRRPVIVFLNTYYEQFLTNYLTHTTAWRGATYEQFRDGLLGESFGDSDFCSNGFRLAGWDAHDLILNCTELQQRWAAENGVTGEGEALALEQVRRLSPDVVYCQDIHSLSPEFLKAVRPFTKLLVGQNASSLKDEPIKLYDIIFSSVQDQVRLFRHQGVAAYYQPLAFEPRLLDGRLVACNAPHVKCSFVGSIASPVHTQRTTFLESLAKNSSLDVWGTGVSRLSQDSPLRACFHGEAWGKQMFAVLHASDMTVNQHGEIRYIDPVSGESRDACAHAANNMRLFEATGLGTLLITDFKDNLSELFTIGTEVVAYRSPEECVALVQYYQNHPDEARAIAQRGQERTLREHTYPIRMKECARVLERHLRYRMESDRFQVPASDKISYGYQPLESEAVPEHLTTGWKSDSIPSAQRGLVQKELHAMYANNIPGPFAVLVELLKPLLRRGESLLEIGCSSGYYSEILEYLLSKPIQYTGVDYSDAMVALAREFYPEKKFVCADGAKLPFKDGQFDYVVSGSILLHVPNYPDHIRETARVAGRFAIVHRQPFCRARPTQRLTKRAYGVETVEIHLNEGEMVNLFAEAGFQLKRAIVFREDPSQDNYEGSFLFVRHSL